PCRRCSTAGIFDLKASRWATDLEDNNVSGDVAGGQRQLFIFSPDDRDALVQAARAVGWRPIGARRAAGAAQRYLRTDAQVVLVDMRGAASRERIAPLAAAAEAGGGALI